MKNLVWVGVAGLLVAVLGGCATPVTYLQGPNGEKVSCGGGRGNGLDLAWGAGYIGEETRDAQCVKSYEAKGYVPLNHPYADPNKIQP